MAQVAGLRPGDAPLTRAELDEMVAGPALVFYDDGQSAFSVGGAYSYTYAGGGTAFGRFEIGDSGEICITFRNGRGRCDIYVFDGDRLVVITQTGDRYPVRSR